ncbi:hypothetical protein [Cyanobacterium sp. Dongsha4]|uniref:hypothetical protein n=1 Tax=Cyanobacterium sp. DS4 TaxID=2878255 RepID=UPI002E81114F|nr:hypothetical protein [Cyanobacterium sp. Dongsha4]WVL00177.1 hypothetical protein Dongsha4_16205 [Cyanobacterium sp. Dongsha4]
MTNSQRQEEYYQLIDRLLRCPSGKEPEILDASINLIDENFVRTVVQVATIMAHGNNQEGSKFLIFIARNLARKLNLYPELLTSTS